MKFRTDLVRNLTLGLITMLILGLSLGCPMKGDNPIEDEIPFTGTFIDKLTASDGTYGDYLGRSVAIDGNVMVIGTNADKAYVFVFDGDEWIQQTTLSASDGTNSFGYSVGISGNTIIVADPYDGTSAQGSMYVFTSSDWGNESETLTETVKLVVSNAPDNNNLGSSSIAVEENIIVAGGAYGSTSGNGGAAYVFTSPDWSGETGTKNETVILEPSIETNPGDGNGFGNGTAISGGIIVIGASNDTVESNTSQGSAYIFTSDNWETEEGTDGILNETVRLIASDGAADDVAGYSVAISGSTVVMGCEGSGYNDIEYLGAAYVFTSVNWETETGTGGILNETVKLQPSEPDSYTSDAYFGVAVAISGDTIVVGAPDANDAIGECFVFISEDWDLDDSPMTESMQLTASDGVAGDSFGDSVAISGNTISVGAPWVDNEEGGPPAPKGAVYIFN